MTDGMTWNDHQEWESAWWGDCTHTFAEETKQITYAHRMGMQAIVGMGTWPVYDLQGMNVLDIGGGPTSMLLKCVNRGPHCIVVDPCSYPKWVHDRYRIAGIDYWIKDGETMYAELAGGFVYDEAWIYNVLQHTSDPALIASNARRLAKRVRVFEWVEAGVTPGHPQNLHAHELDEWFGGTGTVEDMRARPENGCDWIAYYGVFDGIR